MQTIIDIITNKDNTYEGDLKHYFRAIFEAPNVDHPYHNLRHMLHVMWAVHEAGVYYDTQISKRTLRNMLIAALFHDYDHVGKTGNDAENIIRALQGLNKYLLEEDRDWDNLHVITRCIDATEFPHKELTGGLGLPEQIVRDADVAYTLNTVWIQTVLRGLSQEMNLSAQQLLKGQEPFLKSLKFETEWAQNHYGLLIDRRISEAKEMYSVLYE